MKLRIALIVLVITLLVLVPVYAQETTAEATTSAQAEPEVRPVAGVAEAENTAVGSGATTLVLLIGLVAIAVVGFASYMRENPRPIEE